MLKTWPMNTVRTQEHPAGLIKSLFFIRRIYSYILQISNLLISNPLSHSMNSLRYSKSMLLWTSQNNSACVLYAFTYHCIWSVYSMQTQHTCKCKMKPLRTQLYIKSALNLAYLQKTQEVVPRQSRKLGPFCSSGLVHRIVFTEQKNKA